MCYTDNGYITIHYAQYLGRPLVKSPVRNNCFFFFFFLSTDAIDKNRILGCVFGTTLKKFKSIVKNIIRLCTLDLFFYPEKRKIENNLF